MDGLGLFGVMLLSMLAAGGEPDDSGKDLPCCFRHRSWTGQCVVVAEKEQCRDILLYLNDPRSAGKTYCRNTTLRGGWTQVIDEPKCLALPAAPDPRIEDSIAACSHQASGLDGRRRGASLVSG